MPAILALAATGCRTSRQEPQETVAYEKREVLVDRVEEVRNAQVKARQQLQTALYALRRIDTIPLTDLEDLQSELESEVDRTRQALQDLRESISSVESAAESVLEESERSLLAMLRETERSLAEVIPPLEEQVRLLEDALESGATPRKSEQLDQVREQVSSLLEQLEGSIDRTQRFIEEGVEA